VLAFLNHIDTGAGMSEDNPALVLRNRFINIPKGTVLYREQQLALMIKAFNAYAEGRKLKVLRYSAGEEFPSLGVSK
jgi:hypothetical protein